MHEVLSKNMFCDNGRRFVFLFNKVESKKEDDAPQQEEAANELTTVEGDQAVQVKTEDDQQTSQSRKRPYDDGRGYGYYEHREDRRYVSCLY